MVFLIALRKRNAGGINRVPRQGRGRKEMEACLDESPV